MIVENRPGAGNTTGMAAAARAAPDGYTILINSSSHTIVPATFTDLPFDTLSDFAPIVPLGNIPTVLVVSASKGYRSLADLIATAKAKPGAMNYSSAGAGNFSHFAAEVFRRSAGFEAVHVPSKGAPEALTEVLTDRVDFFFSPLILALPFVKDGKLKALAVSGIAARLGVAGCSDHGRGRLSGLDLQFLGRNVRARQGAGDDPESALSANRGGGAKCDGAGKAREARGRSEGDERGRFRNARA